MSIFYVLVTSIFIVKSSRLVVTFKALVRVFPVQIFPTVTIFLCSNLFLKL